MSNLRKIRETMKVSQAILAEKVGCTQGAIGHYESGRRHPDLKMCRQLVDALNSFGAKVQLDDVFPPELNAA
ncbi:MULTISPECIES: helix-turn-helix transcriptional regulator [Enterobacterales]|uniref:helix-turn-helix transcriptional regulator n=1 Tax=Enterobacterales TaxID=91347 RepID=UPI0007944E08|nr:MULTISPECIES: helix-turn-helix transcriptional regulator [Enterobacterales]EGQ5294881.1 helix-turn-helix transcriptional regulator [Enterobacter cloacae]HAV1837526.1 helix-turn-helix transcriptional regulator [Enterobacter hormaechei subsp. steigerwaltii]ELC6296683.1 helix-turn-helix transcriptional regulator [Enterobacter hormaechei]ELC6543165.1 helix-turn-helix transcriptional regulator [Enterobacter hormaechei]ELD3454143.1 helix-turn-helix transcriptional regulator [Enterobacter hormaech